MQHVVAASERTNLLGGLLGAVLVADHRSGHIIGELLQGQLRLRVQGLRLHGTSRRVRSKQDPPLLTGCMLLFGGRSDILER